MYLFATKARPWFCVRGILQSSRVTTAAVKKGRLCMFAWITFPLVALYRLYIYQENIGENEIVVSFVMGQTRTAEQQSARCGIRWRGHGRKVVISTVSK